MVKVSSLAVIVMEKRANLWRQPVPGRLTEGQRMALAGLTGAGLGSGAMALALGLHRRREKHQKRAA